MNMPAGRSGEVKIWSVRTITGCRWSRPRDISFALPVFDGLMAAIQFWAGDEEFPSRICWLWDENARM